MRPLSLNVVLILPLLKGPWRKTFNFATELLTLNDCGFDVPPPGKGLNTVTVNVPAVARSPGRIAAESSVLLMNVVVRLEPAKFTTDVGTKLDPFTVSVNPAPPLTRAAGEMPVDEGRGLLTVNVLLEPLIEPPLCVAVSLKLPALATVTL